MKIKEIMALVKDANPEGDVYFDFCNCRPTTAHSWRGSYDEPAIGWAQAGSCTSVADFLNELAELISGKTYYGWKGGEYSYNEDQTLHVDNPGCYTDTEIIDVKITEWGDVILCARREQ